MVDNYDIIDEYEYCIPGRFLPAIFAEDYTTCFRNYKEKRDFDQFMDDVESKVFTGVGEEGVWLEPKEDEKTFFAYNNDITNHRDYCYNLKFVIFKPE